MISIIPLPIKTLESKIECIGIPREYESMVEFAIRLAIYKTHSPSNCIISVHGASTWKIRQLNRQYRRKDKPTNVLAFPCDALFDSFIPEDIPRNLGDIFICFDVIKREALQQDKPILHHLIHMVVHATLHLNGYDHETQDEGKIMENREERILGLMGIPNPY
jgi:probable rRNA maturation factor